jgi:preprotein translocase subunit SecG
MGCYHNGSGALEPARGPERNSTSAKKGLAFVSFLSPYHQYFQIVQIIVSVALIISILLQSRGSGLGSVFGGTGTVFKTRRGIDRILFRATIVLTVLFVLVSLLGTAIPAPH